MMTNYALLYLFLTSISGFVGFAGGVGSSETENMARALCVVSLTLALLAMMSQHTERRP